MTRDILWGTSDMNYEPVVLSTLFYHCHRVYRFNGVMHHLFDGANFIGFDTLTRTKIWMNVHLFKPCYAYILQQRTFCECAQPMRDGRRYMVMSSLIDWVHAQKDPCINVPVSHFLCWPINTWWVGIFKMVHEVTPLETSLHIKVWHKA